MWTPTLERPGPGRSATPDPSAPGEQDGFLIAERVEGLVARVLRISGMESRDGAAIFYGAPLDRTDASTEEIEAETRRMGFDLWLLNDEPGHVVAMVTPAEPPPARPGRPAVNVALFLATLATTTWAGAWHLGVDLLAEPGRWTMGLPYALALLAILGIHELGHYVTARRRGVDVTLPYFIPIPFFLGTFGAFIRMRGRIRRPAEYFDIGIAGPFAGLVVALAAAAWGVSSETGAVGAAHGMRPDSSFLFGLIYRAVGGETPGTVQTLGPLAFAGWIGLIVTALNLVPVGQLDGGHVAYGLFGRRAARGLGIAFLALMGGAGVLFSPHWLMWAIVVWAIAGLDHPPAANELGPWSPGRLVLGAAATILFLSIVLPWPT